MRRQLTAFVLILVTLYGSLQAQEREKVTNRSGDKYLRTDEVYYVLQADKTIKDGPYQLLRNDKVVVSGYYAHGQKDSVWEQYGRNGMLLSRRWYSAGKRTGEWHFFDFRGNEEWSYDFAGNKATVQRAGPFSDTSGSWYRSDTGWVQGHLDKPLLALSGSGEWLNFLNHTLRYPDEAVNNELQGEVVVGITVDETGAIVDYTLFKTAAPSLNAEALRVVKLYPLEFVPAEIDGKPIKAQFHLPIRFKLEVAK